MFSYRISVFIKYHTSLNRYRPGVVLILFAALVLPVIFNSCNRLTRNSIEPGSGKYSTGDKQTIRYKIVYIIHGDGSYLYFDKEGHEQQADMQVFHEACSVAVTNKDADVHIFHQQPRKRFLFFFSRKNGRYFHFRRGQLIEKSAYYWADYDSVFTPEAQILKKSTSRTFSGDSLITLLLYFGHEIPELKEDVYHRSYPDKKLSIRSFARGLRRLATPAPFDVLMLSTCNSGTPGTILSLLPSAMYIIASPGDLHLSFMDTEILGHPTVSTAGELAFRLAENSFEKLKGNTTTTVTVALYDSQKISDYLNDIKESYLDYNTSLVSEHKIEEVEIMDCADSRLFFRSDMQRGVEVFFRPPLFGRNKNLHPPSGWNCWRLKGREE